MELLSDQVLAAVVPILVYWMYSGMYMAFGKSMDKYRLNPKVHEDTKNMVSKRDVIRVVLTQQLVQLVVVFIIAKNLGREQLLGEVSKRSSLTWPCDNRGRKTQDAADLQATSYLKMACQFAVAVILYDGWHYVWHRAMHSYRFLYRNVHAWHHRLVVPYAFGAMYSHPLEGLMVDNLGGSCAFLISGMSVRVSVFFFSLCVAKGIDNHCGMSLPFNPSFWTDAAYHEVHHQLRGSRHNYSNLFFTTWDKAFGTYMPYVVEERPQEGTLCVRTMTKKNVLSK